ncbi:MAG: decarboxylating 6-phosphogluconate dehydrogenase [Candidatus Diapherotrites archaeon]|uniref:Decarboxylating 6-phosphogluconate dehydrogenase n=1 Tax=Candidatus Iainarchaeum sp. TaxID=3101447 RepID=A0A8T4L3M1_9ARCH|nr:decarboxylating 6-phosphogluconate dehydrogenase [Candidatus Diapherotrites archaeon]
MRIGFIGLGRMGKNMVLRLLSKKHSVVAWNRSIEPLQEVESHGAIGATDFKNLVSQLPSPRIIWTMLPAGDVTEKTLAELLELLSKGDIVIDGANSNYVDTVRRGEQFRERGIHFFDAGVSGGIVGAQIGYCIMIGGPQAAFKTIEPLFSDLTQPEGYRYLGPSGAGHFVKMVHNGIEYAMMQGMAEGFNLLKNGPYPHLDLNATATLWQHGSIIQSFLLEQTQKGLEKDPGLSSFSGHVEDSGEGQWTIETALKYKIPVETIAAALFSRYHSRKRGEFGHKTLSLQRSQFGGHPEKK